MLTQSLLSHGHFAKEAVPSSLELAILQTEALIKQYKNSIATQNAMLKETIQRYNSALSYRNYRISFSVAGSDEVILAKKSFYKISDELHNEKENLTKSQDSLLKAEKKLTILKTELQSEKKNTKPESVESKSIANYRGKYGAM